MQYIDMQDALKRIRGNKKLYRKMLGMFMDSKDFTTLEDSLASGDISCAADAAHSIKGISGNLSMPQLFKISSELMSSLRAGNADAALIASYREILDKTKKSTELTIEELDSEQA